MPACLHPLAAITLAAFLAALPQISLAGRVEEAADAAPEPAVEPAATEPAAEFPADIPAEELGIPKHATKHKMNALAAELRRIAETHGPDSVILQTRLLMRSIAAGAVAPTEVRVVGPSATLGGEYLEIDVDTGIIFTEPETTQNGRTDRIWREVAGPALEGMSSFNLEPNGLQMVFVFGVQHTEESPDPAKPARYERFSVSLPAARLASAAVEKHDAETIRAVADFGALMAVERP